MYQLTIRDSSAYPQTYQLELPFAALYLQMNLYDSRKLKRPNWPAKAIDTLTVGTFGSRTNKLFGLLQRLPDKTHASQYHLYCDADSPTHSILIHYMKDLNIASMPSCEQVYVLIHDWLDNPASFGHLKQLLFAHHKKRQICVIYVDWRSAADNYKVYTSLDEVFNQPAANTVFIGRQLGNLLKRLIFNHKVAADDIHIIGTGMGTVVAHFAANWFHQISDRGVVDGSSNRAKLGRITGLDPTGFMFDNANYITYSSSRKDSLNELDAHFVDIIHTSSTVTVDRALRILKRSIGSKKELGHIDFYPSGEHINVRNEHCGQTATFYCHQNLA